MTDTLQELQSVLPSLGPAVERRKLGQYLSRITVVLRGAPAEIERLDALLETCGVIGFPTPDLAELREVAGEAAEALQTADDADRLRTAQDVYEELLKVISRTRSPLEERLSREELSSAHLVRRDARKCREPGGAWPRHAGMRSRSY